MFTIQRVPEWQCGVKKEFEPKHFNKMQGVINYFQTTSEDGSSLVSVDGKNIAYFKFVGRLGYIELTLDDYIHDHVNQSEDSFNFYFYIDGNLVTHRESISYDYCDVLYSQASNVVEYLKHESYSIQITHTETDIEVIKKESRA